MINRDKPNWIYDQAVLIYANMTRVISWNDWLHHRHELTEAMVGEWIEDPNAKHGGAK